jgi:hypothetical protein
MRSLISCLAALVCVAALAAGSPASAGLFPRHDASADSCANGQCSGSQCSGSQCSGSQCDNGQCSGSDCERNGKHRRPIDVNVDVSPTPVKINVAPTPVNVNVPAPPEKAAAKPELGVAAVGIVAALAFGVAILAAMAAGFHQRASAKKKS